MIDWNLQTWVSAIGAVISIIGAATSWHQARRRMLWDAGRELGGFRVDTVALIAQVIYLDLPDYSIGLGGFNEEFRKWRTDLACREPLLGSRALNDLHDLAELFLLAQNEVFGAATVYSTGSDDHPIIARSPHAQNEEP